MNGRVDFDRASYEVLAWPEDPRCAQEGTRAFYNGKPFRVVRLGVGTIYKARPPECRPDVPVITNAH